MLCFHNHHNNNNDKEEVIGVGMTFISSNSSLLPYQLTQKHDLYPILSYLSHLSKDTHQHSLTCFPVHPTTTLPLPYYYYYYYSFFLTPTPWQWLLLPVVVSLVYPVPDPSITNESPSVMTSSPLQSMDEKGGEGGS